MDYKEILGFYSLDLGSADPKNVEKVWEKVPEEGSNTIFIGHGDDLHHAGLQLGHHEALDALVELGCTEK